MIRKRIEEAIRGAVGEEIKFTVERPGNLSHGDYATNAALVSKMDPQELASKLQIPGVEKIEVVGRFINFFLSHDAILDEFKNPSFESLYAGQTILVEYTQPNPFKEFHIGHLMNNALGESIARLLYHSGAKVIHANYQGDVGPHVAKAVWGKMRKPELSWGEAYVYGNSEYDANKGEIDEINKKIYERSDDTINTLYDQGRRESLAHFEEIYKVLGTKFDHYFFESETGPIGLELIAKHADVFEKSEGATVFRGSHTRVFVTGQGLPTYEAKELGLAKLKQDKAPADMYITVTANEQNGFFEVVEETLRKIFPNYKQMHHSYGMMRFAEGKMSSRTGNVVTGESLLEDLKEKARGRMDVAVGAIKYAILKQKSNKDIIFDLEQSLSTEGDSGPYLQYAHVRAASLLKKAEGSEIVDDTKKVNQLERTLVHFPDVIGHAARDFEPHYVTTYLTEVASLFNSWYAAERLIVDGKVSKSLLNTVQVVEKTLRTGLHLLGIPTPEEM